MRNIMKTSLLIAFAASILTMVGCSDLTDASSTNLLENELSALVNNSSSTVSDDALLYDEFDPMSGDYYAFDQCDGTLGMRGGKGGGKGKGGHHGKGHGNHSDSLNISKGHRHKVDSLALIINCLSLTDEQKVSVQVVKDSLVARVKVILVATREEQKPLRDSARAQAKVVFDQLKAGTITRDEAHTQLDAIRAALETALAPSKEAAVAQIKVLRDASIQEIRALLTAEQQAILDAWIATGVVPC